MSAKRTEKHDDSAWKRDVAKALKQVEQRVERQQHYEQHMPADQREKLRAALALEGLVLQPDGSVKGKSDSQ